MDINRELARSELEAIVLAWSSTIVCDVWLRKEMLIAVYITETSRPRANVTSTATRAEIIADLDVLTVHRRSKMLDPSFQICRTYILFCFCGM